jgi:hypothetical protein
VLPRRGVRVGSLAGGRCDGGDPDWVELAELVQTSYRQIALKRQLAALDAIM